MHYGYDTETGYVRAIWGAAPDERERGELKVLEVNHPSAPTAGFWRVKDGQLIELPGTPERYEARLARIRARREAEDAISPRIRL